ncbi:MAG: D-glycerate dehydrogenase [Chloroflexi bacterium GWB2_49_20]|nr:MAG: D-glycerate dehydrogenase [Chloroflexi bacterium GWB2_49_20]OGN76119.1 MAG: D-glycerate dehydrogenase [Chloroflexi bacterium GWC2_49_37]OGN83505.1 MAG: D-glycerate dehydrogenase [Chloroflexi bacterium GWD2_49_16]HBG73906.1 D-glycerate dehydrogenase [Anaerolineae bacterium]HCC79515.1 D-glycerate dehydrogenase [Anaerolineae bacterium]
MSKPKVFVTRKILDRGMEMIQQFCDADIWLDDLPPSRQVLSERVRGKEGLLSLLTDNIDAGVMDAAGKNLKVISNHAVGYDNIDIAAATRRRIPVGNTPGILTDATADFAFTLLLSSARRITEADHFVRSGLWKTWGPTLMLGADISGATLGIIGFGRIGQAVAKRAEGFNMQVLFYDPNLNELVPGVNAHPVNLDILLHQSDFISIHTPLTVQTRHLINKAAFDKMKPNAILVNTARGAVIDPSALYTALKNKRIQAAALDVTESEPIPLDSPLLELENLILCPHIASASNSTRARMSIMAAENLIAGLKGEKLPNCVNSEIYD